LWIKEASLKKPSRVIPWIFGILWGIAVGCGYHFVGGTADLPPDVQSVAIPMFANRTIEEGIESDLTRAMVDKFTSSKRIPVLGEDGADTILLGTIRSLVTSPITVTLQTQTVTEYRATMTIEIILKKGKEGKVLRKEELSEWRNYPVSASLTATDVSKKEAIRQISTLLADRVHEAILTNF
jgi:hypothetical protein